MTETIGIVAIADQSNREKEIFEQALDITPAEERLRFLTNACGKDAALLARVQALLRADESGESFLPEQPKAAAVPITEKPGDRIGRYKLLQQIGEGGCGAVYMAEQTEPVRRRVALKVIKLGMDTRQVIARFEAERQALALMDHPNIAKVLEAGATETGRPYFVMELVRGIKITQFCDEKSVPTADRLTLFTQVCQAIQHAHQKGVIHRDIKPSNILVTVNDGVPVPKIIDFGIAKATAGPLTDKTFFTAFEQFIGTPAYMSPEQAEMTSLDIDTRSDIYSLGVLLYELLTGRTPFDPSELLQSGLDEMRRTIREKEPVRPSTRLTQELVSADLRRLKPSSHDDGPSDQEIKASSHRLLQLKERIHLLRGDLDWIVMKCLEKDRTRRYETANGLAMDIQRHLNNEPVLARPPSKLYRLQKAFRRNKLAFGTAAFVAVVLASGVIVSTIEAFRAIRSDRLAQVEARRASGQAKRAREAEIVATRERDHAEANLYAADMLLAQRAWDESNLGLALDLLNKHRPLPRSKDFRDWEWRYLWRLCQSDELFTLDRQPDNVSGVAFSPDGSRVATASWWENPNEGEVRIWDFNGRRLIATPNHQDAVGSVAFSADGALLAFGTFNHGVTVWSIALGQEVASFPVRQRPRVGCGLSFSPEGHILAIGDNEGAVTVWDTEAKVRRLTLSGHRAAVSSVVFLPDRKTLASASRDGIVRLWNLATGQSIAEFQHRDGVQSVAVSPDGKTLVSGGWQNTIHVWDIGSRTQLFVLTNHTAWVSSLAFSPDGESLISASADHTLRLWDAATWHEIDTFRGHHDEVSGVVFSPDGKWLLSGAKNGEVKFWNPVREHREINFLKWPDDLQRYTVASDGSAVGVLHHDGNVSLWELPSLRQTARCLLPDSQSNIILFDLAPRGKRIAYVTTDGWLKVWDCEIGQELRRIQHNWAGTFVFEFSSTGRILVSGGESPFMTLWDPDALKSIATLPRSQKNPVRLIAFSRDDQLLAAGTSDGAIEVWNIPRKEQLILAHHRGLAGLGLMPDNQSLATVGSDATARIWDLSTRRQKVTMGKTLNAFNCIVAAPNGLRLATGANTDYISLWDPSTGLEIARLRGHHQPVVALLFLPDGNTLVSAAGDGLRIWRAPSWLEIEAAEKAAGDYSH